MLGNIMKIENLDNNSIKVRVVNFAPLILVRFLDYLIIAILLVVAAILIAGLKNFFIIFPVFLLLFGFQIVVLFFDTLDRIRRMKKISIILSKEGSNFLIQFNTEKNSRISEFSLNPDLRLIFTKNWRYFNLASPLILANGSKFYLLLPSEIEAMQYIPNGIGDFGTDIKRILDFSYTEDDAKKIAAFLNIPIEIKKQDFWMYLYYSKTLHATNSKI